MRARKNAEFGIESARRQAEDKQKQFHLKEIDLATQQIGCKYQGWAGES